MTSYLSAVSAREFAPSSPSGADRPGGVPAGIAPRRASPFEPWSIAGTLEGESVERDERGASETESVSTADRPDVTAPAHSDMRVSRDQAEPAVVKPAQPSYLGAHVITATPATRERVSDTLSPPTVPHAHVPAERPRAAAELSIAAQRPAAPPTPPRAEPRGELERTAPPPARNDSGTPASHTLTRAPVLPPKPTPFVVQPRRTEPRTDTKPASRAETPREAAPAVVVTIGRLEIRAVPATGTRKTTAHAEPAMSLSDYLRERAQGLR